MAFLNLLINPFFIFSFFFLHIFFICIKMSKNFWAIYYQENKERLQKKTYERNQNPSKEKKKSVNMVVSVTKISQKMKNKSLLSIEKNIVKWKKKNVIKRKYSNLKNVASL